MYVPKRALMLETEIQVRRWGIYEVRPHHWKPHPQNILKWLWKAEKSSVALAALT